MSDQTRPPRRVMSPVDYEAWNNGYEPPSSHRLIHELMYCHCEILCSSDMNGSAYWLVTRGDPFKNRNRHKAQMMLIEMAMDAAASDPPSDQSAQAIVAQSEEREPSKLDVVGSNPAGDASDDEPV